MGETYRIDQPIGKQYSCGYGQSPDEKIEEETLKIQNPFHKIKSKLKKVQRDRKVVVKEVFIELVENYKAQIPIKDILRPFNTPKATYYRRKQSKPLNASLSKNESLVINKCKDTNFEYGYRNIKGFLAND